MQIRLTYTNGRAPGADLANENYADIELKISNFEKYFRDHLYKAFEEGMHGWIGGTYKILWDNRHPNAQSINARLGTYGRKVWRYRWADWSIHFHTIIMDEDVLHSVPEDAFIDNAVIERYKFIRPLNGNYSSGKVINGGTLFNSATPIYWHPI